ncbi:MAG TPA: DUF1501 domain-containing protein [Verrucomicrobiales bacterium]|nr:DUF1501 domain-containing protein [Verrucomicrobiales bacterium]
MNPPDAPPITRSQGTRAPAAWTRRRMLERSGAGLLLPALLGRGFIPANALGQQSSGAGTDGAEGPIVVVVQLGGGNDSLNTLVPYQRGQSAIYYEARPSLAIPPQAVLPLDGVAHYGLHPALIAMRELWARGEMAVVEGVGYHSPDLSHFSSMDYWHSAEPNRQVRDGWLGRFFQHRCAGGDTCPLSGLDLGGAGSLAFHSGDPAGRLAIGSARDFGWRPAGSPPDAKDFEGLVRRLNGLGGGVRRFRGSRGVAFHHVRRSIQNAFQSADGVRRALDHAPGSGGTTTFPKTAFPDTTLGQRFLDIATLIHGRLPVSVYYVDQGGYDTHAGQVSAGGQDGPLTGRHADLLSELDQALGAFAAEMKAQGHWRRILVFTFSEFGRKVAQNGSFGTDHGAAQSILTFGGSVRRGLYGQAPSLRADARIKNDSMAFNTDFRRVYRTVLETWLGAAPETVLQILPETAGTTFQPLGFV